MGNTTYWFATINGGRQSISVMRETEAEAWKAVAQVKDLPVEEVKKLMKIIKQYAIKQSSRN